MSISSKTKLSSLAISFTTGQNSSYFAFPNNVQLIQEKDSLKQDFCQPHPNQNVQLIQEKENLK